MNRLYAEGTLCRFSAAAGKDRAHKSTELMNNNNHVFAKAEETSNSARQHAWGQQRSVRVFSSVPKDDHCWISCVLHLHN